MLEFTISPPGTVRRCPDCMGGEMFDGSVSVITKTDGSTTIRYAKGSPCPTCDGSGYVKIEPAEPVFPKEMLIPRDEWNDRIQEVERQKRIK